MPELYSTWKKFKEFGVLFSNACIREIGDMESALKMALNAVTRIKNK